RYDCVATLGLRDTARDFAECGGSFAMPSRKCDADWPKRARNARAKLQQLSKPLAAATSPIIMSVSRSRSAARSSRSRADSACGLSSYRLWNVLDRYQLEKLVSSASSPMRT